MPSKTAPSSQPSAAPPPWPPARSSVLGFIRPGVRREIAMELERHLRANGAEGLAFDKIVASGPRASMQHGAPTDKAVQAGEFVLMDFGAIVDGYLSDMTRTVVVGRASAEQRKVYETVRRAQEHGLASIKPDWWAATCGAGCGRSTTPATASSAAVGSATPWALRSRTAIPDRGAPTSWRPATWSPWSRHTSPAGAASGSDMVHVTETAAGAKRRH